MDISSEISEGTPEVTFTGGGNGYHSVCPLYDIAECVVSTLREQSLVLAKGPARSVGPTGVRGHVD